MEDEEDIFDLQSSAYSLEEKLAWLNMQKSLLMQEAREEKRMIQRRPVPPVGRPTPLANMPTMSQCPRSVGRFNCDCNSPDCVCRNG